MVISYNVLTGRHNSNRQQMCSEWRHYHVSQAIISSVEVRQLTWRGRWRRRQRVRLELEGSADNWVNACSCFNTYTNYLTGSFYKRALQSSSASSVGFKSTFWVAKATFGHLKGFSAGIITFCSCCSNSWNCWCHGCSSSSSSAGSETSSIGHRKAGSGTSTDALIGSHGSSCGGTFTNCTCFITCATLNNGCIKDFRISITSSSS